MVWEIITLVNDVKAKLFIYLIILDSEIYNV